jgi:hypothetical protein
MTCCNSLFVNLGGGVNTGVLQTPTALSSTLQVVEDQSGTDSAMQLSTTGVTFGTGTLTPNGVLTVKGAGSNILSLRNASNVEKFIVDDSGNTIAGGVMRCAYFEINFGLFIAAFADGDILMRKFGTLGFNKIMFGNNTADYPALFTYDTPARIDVKDATGTNLIPFSAEDFTSANLTSGTLTTARPMQFGDKGTITDAGLVALGLDAQIAVEHNGNIYYIPCSTSLIS